MIKYNLETINDWFYSTDNIIKVYRNNAICYYKIDSSSPSGQTPCYAVVEDITQYQDTEFEDVFNQADGKWYKLNNLNQYEEYGVYGDSIATSGSSRLPQGYTEVEYIRQNSNYNAYINTGVIIFDNTTNTYTITTKLTSEFHSNLGCATIIACENPISTPAYYGLGYRYKCSSTVDQLEFYGASPNYSASVIDNGDDTRDVIFQSTGNTSWTLNTPLIFFANWASTSYDSINRPSDATIYSSTIVKNGVTVRDFVPAKRDSDSVYGLYDLITDTFYTSPNGNNFSGGSAVTPTSATYYQGKLAIVDGYEYQYSGSSWNNVGEVSGSSRLPQGYTEVEYVENTTQAYLNLGVYPYSSSSNSYAVEAKFSSTQGTNQFEYLFSCEQGNLSPYVGFICRWQTIRPRGLVIDGTNYTSKNITNNQDGTSGFTITSNLTNATNTTPITLFCGLQGSTVWRNGKGKVYSFKVTINDNLVRDMIPCKRDNDNVVGMYDIVNDVFYYPPNYTSYQLVAGSATGTTIYPIYYDVIQDPPNNLSFSSMTEAEEYECPWVGMVATIDGVDYIFSGDSTSGYEWVLAPVDYTKEYLTFEPISSAVTFRNSTKQFQYSLDKGATWTTLTTANTVTVNVGQKLMVKGNFGAGSDNDNGNKFITSGGTWKAYGNVLSLLGSDNYTSTTAISNSQLINLFRDCTTLINVDNLKMPAYTAGSKAIRGMFRNCSGLVHVPSDLLSTFTAFTSDATAMGIFEGCTNLLESPIIPNMTVGSYGAYGMFFNCTSLTACTCLLTANNITGNKTQDLLNGVNTANGVFYKNPNTTWSSSAISNSKIPSNWTIQDYSG